MNSLHNRMQFDHYRQIKIVKMLLERSVPIQCHEFSKEFRVSERMIRDDIKALKSILKVHGVDLLSKRGIGYYLNLNNVDLEAVIQESLGSLYYYDNVGVIDKFAREQLILRCLILHEHPMKPQEIMDEFYISRTTLKKDLERAKETIEHYPIKLITKPYQGIYLEGSEVGKRMLLNRETAFYKDQSIFHMLYDRIEMNGITIEALLHFVKDVCCIEISNIDLFNLYSHLNIMLLRIAQRQFVKKEELVIDAYLNQKDLKNVRDFLNKYEDFQNIPDEEIVYFALLIFSSGYSKNKSIIEEKKKVEILLDALEKDFYHPMLDQTISDDLARRYHILKIKALNRFSSSPLLIRDIKKWKPLAIELACRYALEMDYRYHIHLFDNDICALAHIFQKHALWKRKPFRILVVSARGSLYTEGLLMKQLQEELYHDCFTYCDLYDLDKKIQQYHDVIITDISLANHALMIPVVKVDFFSVEKNIIEIKAVLEECTKRRIEGILKTIQNIQASKKEDVFQWFAKASGQVNLYDQLLIREEMLTYEVNKRLACICVFLPSDIHSFMVRFPQLYWKNAMIEYAIFVNINSSHPGDYELYETLIKNFDSYVDKK